MRQAAANTVSEQDKDGMILESKGNDDNNWHSQLRYIFGKTHGDAMMI